MGWRTLKTQTLNRSFGFFLLAAAVVVSLVILALMQALPVPGLLASVGWNFVL